MDQINTISINPFQPYNISKTNLYSTLQFTVNTVVQCSAVQYMTPIYILHAVYVQMTLTLDIANT